MRRKGLRLSQSQLAGRLGVPVNTLARWERGELAIRHPEMLRLSLQAIEAELNALSGEEQYQRNLELQGISRVEQRHERRHRTPQRDLAEKRFENKQQEGN